jgi:A/G-specific adenine glycosylase
LGIHTPINSPEGVKEFKTKAQQLMDVSQPAAYNQAVMEFGALHCRPKSPKCMFCVFQQDCAAYQLGKVEELPVKLKKTVVKKRYFNYLIFKDQDNLTLVQKRSGAGIWKGLYQFPLLESEEPLETPSSEDIKTLLDTGDFHIDRIEKLNDTPVVHLLSHRKIMATFIQVSAGDSLSRLKLTKGIETYNLKELQKLPVPVLIQNFIESEFSLA